MKKLQEAVSAVVCIIVTVATLWYYPGLVREVTLVLQKNIPSLGESKLDSKLFPYYSEHINEIPNTIGELLANK